MNFFATISETSTFNPVTGESVETLDVETHVSDGVADRTRVHGWSVGADRPDLAARLARAIQAGAVHSNPEIRTDVNGRTFVTASSRVVGRRMSADLKALGF